MAAGRGVKGFREGARGPNKGCPASWACVPREWRRGDFGGEAARLLREVDGEADTWARCGSDTERDRRTALR